ncbi:hypothetical protein PR202_ga01796 [Eleusine coracana subsp. coracana]|uniref:Uncharacterized protein n=1 Tax=Eleusine coracana subsp. coracana TaxID=191504 RepID=A0AAV5BI94_ELECO|nr:hypothetical protein PR202_ga01109 [Eleusine coracana subsp. coracana]GJM85983.1 hypothetical protein PR202_ga01796 [Eleusine coracana subsp. coracana]
MIFLQVVQLLSQACCLPLPKLSRVKAQVILLVRSYYVKKKNYKHVTVTSMI